MERKGIERFAPLAGVLFLLMVIVAIVVTGEEPPGTDESAAEIAEFYKDNDSKMMISAALEAWAAVVLVWFGGSVRERIASVAPGGGRLAAIAFAGSIIAAVGLATDGALQFAAADAADDIAPEGIQTINAIWSSFFFPMIVGVALLTLASGLAAIRHGAFNKVLGWIAIVIGVISLTPVGFVGAIAAVLWIGAMGIVLFRSQDADGPGAPPPAAPEAPVAPA